MSVESDFVYIGEKNSKEAQDYEINLLSPEDFEIIRPRCDIPSPLEYSLEEGVSRPVNTPMTEANPSKDTCASDNPSSSHPSTGKETIVDNLTAKLDGGASEGSQKDKVVRPLTSYCLSLRRKDGDFGSSTNAEETLDLPFIDSPLTSNASSDANTGTVSFGDGLESNKSAESSSMSKPAKGTSQKSTRGSGHYQSTLVIVTPPGFKVGADSLPTGKATSGLTNILPNGKTVRPGSNKLRPTKTMSSVALKSLPVIRNKKEDPLYPKGSLGGGSSVLVRPKYTPVATSDFSAENRHVHSPRDNSNDNEKLEDSSSESQQSAIFWKSGDLLSQSSAEATNGETDEKASQSSGSGYEGQELSCLSPDSCYGVNVVIDDTNRNIPQFQASEGSQPNVAILEGYDQPLAVSSGLLSSSTVSEQAFLHITSMNSETDSVPSDRLSGEVVITQHVLSFPQLYSCHWEGCNTHLLSVEDLISHAVSAHVKPGKDQQYCCLWQGCQRDGRTFNARYKMLIHLRTHTGEKPHVCQVDGCGKSFSRMENLKIHMRCHTGEKPYKCPYEGCGKKYSNSSDRFKHTKTHYEKKPYRCKFEGCQKSYTDPSSLRKHHKSHRTKVALSLFVQSESESL